VLSQWGKGWGRRTSAARTSSAASTAMPPTYTKLPNMSGWKRAPSSLVKYATLIGCTVATPCCSSVSITSSPPSTPRLPSNRPPVRTVSMCEPTITAAACGLVPARVPTTLPTASTTTERPRSCIQLSTRSRPSRSASVSASRAEPRSPAAPCTAPTSPNASRRAHRRSPSMRRVAWLTSPPPVARS